LKQAGDSNVSSAVSSTQDDAAKLSISAGLLTQTAPDARAGQVAALQQAISAGTYNVSASDVADRLIASLMG
jgi:anti-sigma28 factor (negative regulator of flagellin synthesis)